MTEHELLGEVTSLAGQLGLLWHHCEDSRRCQGHKGFPDLLIAGPRGLIIAELKAEDGNTRTGQQTWLRTAALALNGHGTAYARIWRPADLANGTIREELAGLC